MGAKYKAIFFDADDTLFDYPRAERAALRACLREFGLRVDLGTFVDSYRRHNLDVWQAFERGETDQATLRVERFRRVAAEFGISGLPLEKVSTFYLESLSGQPQLCPEPWRRSARWRRVPPGPDHQRHRRGAAPSLRRLAHHPLFSIRGHFRGGRHRQARPADLRARPAKIGVEAGDVLYVGDSVTSDMAAARNAGMDFCWLNPGRVPVPAGPPPVFIIADIQELPGCLINGS